MAFVVQMIFRIAGSKERNGITSFFMTQMRRQLR